MSSGYIHDGVDRAMAESKVAAPAVLLMITSGMGIALHLAKIAVDVIGVGFTSLQPFGTHGGDLPPGFDKALVLASGGVGIAIDVLFVGLHVLALVGALRMKALRSYNLALAGAIVALVACSPSCCCCVPLSLPFAVWALIVLSDAGVKAAFV